MANCNGKGECLNQCVCICYDEENDIPLDICECGHRAHISLIGGPSDMDRYCHIECPHNCQLVECHNFRLCGKKYPQWILDGYNNTCIDCTLHIGKIDFLDEKDDCPICMEHQEMIQVSCKMHTICLACWTKMADTGNVPIRCPLCRESIWKWRNRD
jgi:hypothetical protein